MPRSPSEDEPPAVAERPRRIAKTRYACGMHMVPIIVHVGVLALTVFVLSRVTAGVWLKNPTTAIPVAVVFSLLNWAIGRLLAILLWIPGVLTLGLVLLFSSLIVNTVLLYLVDKLLASFELKTLRALLLSSSAITLVNGIFHFLSWR